MLYAQIVPLQSIPLSRPQVFTYRIEEKLKPGQLVLIPFAGRKIKGIVIEVTKSAPTKISRLKKINSSPLPFPLLTAAQIKLAYFMADYYCQPLSLVFKTIAPPFLPKKPNLNQTIDLSQKQIQSPNQNKPSLLLTLVRGQQNLLLSQIKESLKKKKQILYLVPELTQILSIKDTLLSNFPEIKLAILSSHISPKKYFDAWLKILSNQAQIILGTRQAIFAPLSSQSLIIVDNEHNEAFKQWEAKPFYDARVVAEEYARLTASQLIFSTPAPTVSRFWQAKEKKYKIFPAKPSKPSTDITVVDMRRELSAGNFSIFSYPLTQALKKVLVKNKQALFYVSRHGEYKFVMCRDCGYVLSCPQCQISLTQTSQKNLACPLCGLTQAMPPACPQCHSMRLKGFGAGVEQIAQELKKKFPQAKIEVLNPVVTRSWRKLAKIYQQFDTGQIDVLVGSQAALTWQPFGLELVGVINIDSLLFAPWWSASQQVFGLLSQIFNLYSKTKIIIQTYNPEHKLLRWAQKNDYQNFFTQEIKFRQALGYPPFYKIIKLQNKNPSQTRVIQEGQKIKDKIKKKIKALKTANNKTIKIFGPFLSKSGRQFKISLIIKIKRENYNFYFQKIIKPLITTLPASWTTDVDPEKLR